MGTAATLLILMGVLLLRMMAPAWFLLAFVFQEEQGGPGGMDKLLCQVPVAGLKVQSWKCISDWGILSLLGACSIAVPHTRAGPCSRVSFHSNSKSSLLCCRCFCFFPHLCPKLLGGSTCLYNCAYIETVLLFSLYRKQQLSNLDQINYKNVCGNCSCS